MVLTSLSFLLYYTQTARQYQRCKIVICNDSQGWWFLFRAGQHISVSCMLRRNHGTHRRSGNRNGQQAIGCVVILPPYNVHPQVRLEWECRQNRFRSNLDSCWCCSSYREEQPLNLYQVRGDTVLYSARQTNTFYQIRPCRRSKKQMCCPPVISPQLLFWSAVQCPARISPDDLQMCRKPNQITPLFSQF